MWTEVSPAVGRNTSQLKDFKTACGQRKGDVRQTRRGQIRYTLCPQQRSEIGSDIIQHGFKGSLEWQKMDWNGKVEIERPSRWLLKYR